VERTAVLIHLVDATQDDVAEAYRTIRQELTAYGEGLAEKREILALNKVDALDPETRLAKAAELAEAAGLEPRLISGVSGEGVTDVLRAAWGQVRERRTEEKAALAAPEQGWTP
jgi:GTP-binding protein